LLFITACSAPSNKIKTIATYRLAFGSCLDQNNAQPIWHAIAAENPHTFMFLGDTIYADTESMAVKKTEYQKLRANPGFQKLKSQTPVWAMWDDHDYGKNDLGVAYKPKAESQSVFLDAFDEPSDSLRRKQKGIYFAKEFIWQNLRIHVIVPDLRYHRTEWKKGAPTELYTDTHAVDASPQATILGEVQWAWLKNEFSKHADLRIFVSSSAVLTDDFPGERWGAMPRERDKLFGLMKASRASVIIVSGDRHFAQVLRRSDVTSYPLFEIVSSGMNNGWAEGRRDVDRYRIGEVYAANNFGLLEIDSEAKEIRYSLQGADGAPQIGGALSFDEIKLRRADNTGN